LAPQLDLEASALRRLKASPACPSLLGPLRRLMGWATCRRSSSAFPVALPLTSRRLLCSMRTMLRRQRSCRPKRLPQLLQEARRLA